MKKPRFVFRCWSFAFLFFLSAVTVTVEKAHSQWQSPSQWQSRQQSECCVNGRCSDQVEFEQMFDKCNNRTQNISTVQYRRPSGQNSPGAVRQVVYQAEKNDGFGNVGTTRKPAVSFPRPATVAKPVARNAAAPPVLVAKPETGNGSNPDPFVENVQIMGSDGFEPASETIVDESGMGGHERLNGRFNETGEDNVVYGGEYYESGYPAEFVVGDCSCGQCFSSNGYSACGGGYGCGCSRCSNSFSALYDFYERNFGSRFFEGHNACCCCAICNGIDHADMLGDAAWMRGRFVELAFPNSGSTNNDLRLKQSSPIALLSRLNVAEHFNGEVRDRIWFDYRHLNNTSTLEVEGVDGFSGRNRAVDQFTFGFEKQLGQYSSLELRVPFFNQMDSVTKSTAFGDTSTEFGNLSLIYKLALMETNSYAFITGMGLTFPTAKDWEFDDIDVKFRNKTYYLVPYFGVQWRPRSSSFGHFIVQVDIPLSSNELTGGAENVKVKEQNILRAGLQLGRWFFQSGQGPRRCRLGGFVELDYSAVTKNSGDEVTSHVAGPLGNYIYAGSGKNNAQTLNFVTAMPIQFGRLSMTHSIILPLRNNEKQFSAAYNFSLSQRF